MSIFDPIPPALQVPGEADPRMRDLIGRLDNWLRNVDINATDGATSIINIIENNLVDIDGMARIWYGANKAALPTATVVNGDFGYTTSTYRGYQYLNGAWVCFTHLE